MKAIFANAVNYDDPLSAIAVGNQPEPTPRSQWSTIETRAVTINRHDLWSLQGVGLRAEQTPMILGTDGAGILAEDIPGRRDLAAGEDVVAYTVIGSDGAGVSPGEHRSILTEKYPGTMAERFTVPAANIFRMPENLDYVEAAALGTSWLTAYAMLFDAARISPGDSVLIQGAGGGVSTAAIQLARAAGFEIHVTSRSEAKREQARDLGAHYVYENGERLVHKVDAVIESVGAATWSHSVKSVRPGGTIAICGATSGDQPGAELTRIFFQDLRVQGVTMGSRDDFARLLRFVELADLHPIIAQRYAVGLGTPAATRGNEQNDRQLDEAGVRQAFAHAQSDDRFGKIALL